MRYVLGDSSESNLDFNYLAFLREVIDCAAVLAEAEVTLASNVDYGRTREKETAAVVAAVEDLGKRATQLVGPVAKEQGGTPVGRCAALIANAVREAVEKESSQARATLATAREEMGKEDQRLHARTREVLEKLLRTHDLPGAEKELEVAWSGSTVKATMRQRTGFGVEAVISLEIPVGSVFAPDLRVDRIAEAVEVHALEAGGWLKKSDKLVPHKLGRYQIIRVSVGTDVSVRLRSGTDAAAVFDLKVPRNGEIVIERTGGGPREFTIDDKDRPGLKVLVDKLEAAARLLETRGALVSIEIDGKLLAAHGHPRVLAERLVTAIAPTVQKIARHSRSPGELVLRRLLADDRREEVFISTGELLKRFEALPAPAREIFAPLGLGGEPPRAEVKSPPVADVKPEVRPPGATSPPPVSAALIPPAAPRAPSRTSPPPITGERPVVPAPAPKPTRPPPVSEAAASPSTDTPSRPTRLPAALIVDKPDSPEGEEPRRKRPDSKSVPIVAVSSDDDGTPPAK